MLFFTAAQHWSAAQRAMVALAARRSSPFSTRSLFTITSGNGSPRHQPVCEAVAGAPVLWSIRRVQTAPMEDLVAQLVAES